MLLIKFKVDRLQIFFSIFTINKQIIDKNTSNRKYHRTLSIIFMLKLSARLKELQLGISSSCSEIYKITKIGRVL